jgi:CHAT domain-containing protein
MLLAADRQEPYVLGESRRHTGKSPNLSVEKCLVVGDPLGDLGGARAEAEAVAELLGVEPLLGSKASRQEVLAGLEGKTHFHFAGHGAYFPGNVLNSGIELSDGILSAQELVFGGVGLGATELVVLSSCWSGMQVAVSGSEVLGLVNAVLSSGAVRVVASGWELSDYYAAEVMVQLYSQLLDTHEAGQAVGEALVNVSNMARTYGRALGKWAALSLHGVW